MSAADEHGVPDALAPPPHHPRFPLLDGMRALAALSVLLFHSTPAGTFGGRYLTHLNIGVTIFFLISGFLLYRPFIAHRTGGAAAPREIIYLKRRALRIFPAYWVLLAGVLLLPGLLEVRGGDLLGQFALLQTMPFAGPDGCGNAFSTCSVSHTWSLAVEATFYLALPIYAFAAERIARGRPPARWVPVELALLAAFATASVLAHYVLGAPDQTSLIGGTLVGYGLWFALGMGLAVVSVGIAGLQRRPRVIELIARSSGALWLSAIVIYAVMSSLLPANAFLPGSDGTWAHLAFGLIALLLMLPAVFGGDADGLPQRLLAHPLTAWLGLISYGIFLWHVPVIFELERHGVTSFGAVLPITLIASIVIAAASYYLVERPLLRFK